MNRRIRPLLVGLLAMLLPLSACGNPGTTGGKLGVVVSINQWSSLAEQIGGDRVQVTSILANQNVDAHEFEPQPADIAAISNARLVLVNGADYDAWAVSALKNSHAVVVDAARSAGIEAGANPHVWFSAAVRAAAAQAYTNQLIKLDPKDATYFKDRYQAWQDREKGLDATIASARKVSQGLSYAATESVAHYLGEDLGMKDVTPTGYSQAIANESEPAPADLKAFQERLADRSAKLLFVNDQEVTSTTKMISQAATKAGVPIVHITESMPNTYKDLEAWMTSLIGKVQAALKGQSGH